MRTLRPSSTSTSLRCSRLALAVLLAVLGTACDGASPSGERDAASPRAEAPPATSGSDPSPAPAQPAPPVEAPRAEPGAAPASGFPAPRLVFEAPARDFGRVSDVRPLKHAFAFRNAGNRTLMVNDVKASCGCTTTQLAKKSYEPGEGGHIETSWEPKGFGKQKKTITVVSNAGAPVTLSIEADVEPFVSVEPPYFAFGRVAQGSEQRQRAALRCADPELEIVELQCTNPHFRAELEGDGASGREIVVTMLPSAPWGTVTANLRLKVRGRVEPGAEPVEHSTDIGMSAQVFGEIELDRTLFAIGRVDPGAAFRAEVLVTRSTGKPFALLEARLESPTPSTMTLTSEPLDRPGQVGYRLIVSGESGGHLGLVRASVAFRTDVPGEPERTIQVMGMVRALETHEH